MPRLTHFRMHATLVALCMIAGCASSSNTSSGAGYPDRDTMAFSNFLVASIAENYTNRAQFERTVVSGLRQNGASAIAYYEAIGGNKPITRENIRELVEANGYDAVLITRVLASAQQVDLKQGSAAAKVTRRDGRPVDFFRYDYEELDEPPTLEFRSEGTIAAELYRASDEEMVWTADITTSGADNVGKVIDEVADDVLKGLRRSKHIAR